MQRDRPDVHGTGASVIRGLHHIGFLVPDIPTAAETYTRRYGYELTSDIILDPTQTAYVQFLRVPGDSVHLELVSPAGEQSKLSNALRKGGGLNHLCYATNDIEAACRFLRTEQMMLLQPPVAAVAFPGRRIAWLMGADRTPIELVESGDDSAP